MREPEQAIYLPSEHDQCALKDEGYRRAIVSTHEHLIDSKSSVAADGQNHRTHSARPLISSQETRKA
jgi:hypothetical protein